MTSVTRNSHIPSVAASCCCVSESKWCCCAGWCACPCGSAWAAAASDNFDLPLRILVGALGHHRLHVEIVRDRRRLRRPLESGGVPRIVARLFPVVERGNQVDRDEHVADRKDRGAG